MRSVQNVVAYPSLTHVSMRGANKILGRLVKKLVYEMVKYTLKSGGEGSKCELVAKEISVASFISNFKTNIFYKYSRYSHRF